MNRSERGRARRARRRAIALYGPGVQIVTISIGPDLHDFVLALARATRAFRTFRGPRRPLLHNGRKPR